jgi:uncharacterized protein YoxC
VLETLVIVVAVLLGVLVGAALPVLSQLRRTLKAAENTMLQSGTKIDHVLEQASEAAGRINRLSTDLEAGAGHLKGVFELLEGLGDLAARLSDKVRIVDSMAEALGPALVAAARAVWPDGKEPPDDSPNPPRRRRASSEKEESQS